MATFNHVLLETLHMPTQVYDINRWWSCCWRWMVSHCISSLINKWFPTVCYTSCRLMLPSYRRGMNEQYVDLTSRFEKTNSTAEFCTTKLLSSRRCFEAKMSRCGNYHRPPSRVQDIYWFPCFWREQSCSGLQILNLPQIRTGAWCLQVRHIKLLYGLKYWEVSRRTLSQKKLQRVI